MSKELGTVLFTDVEGSTDLRTRRGDDAAHRRLQALHEVVSKEIEHHGGRVIKTLGDGVLALFRSPRSAVASAVAIQREVTGINRSFPDEPLRVRIGINTGEVLEEDGDVFGESVNAAARISALAEGGQTLVSAILKDLVGTVPDLIFEDKGSHQLKGFAGQWRLFQVDSEESPQLMLLDKTPFVGRQTELAQLDRYLEQAIRGRGGVVLIGGEPGVGKTRLAEEVALRAQQKGMLNFAGHCFEMEAAIPYAPFVEILEATAETIPADTFREVMGDSAPELARFAPQIRKMFPDIPPSADLPGEEDRRYTFNSISRYMRRSATLRPIILILDDLHWGDESTLLLLEHLALNLSDVPVLVIGTYRDVELATSRPLARTLETLVRQRAAHRLALKRLTQQDVHAMLHRLSGSDPPRALVEAIFSETEGNAFFVEEVFRHLLEEGKLLDTTGTWRPGLQIDELDVPEGVRLVIGRRLDRLRDETKKVLTVGAVLGRVFEFDLISKIDDVAQLDPLEAMDEAEAAHLITSMKGRDARYSFVHELVRQTLLTDISLPRRQRLHLQIASAIEAKHSSNLDRYTSDLAHHLYQAGAAADPDKTIEYLIRAGDHAQSIAAYEDALRGYEAALSLIDDELQRGKVLYKIGRAKRGLRGTEAQAAFEEALEIFERLGDKDALIRTCLMIADRHTFSGEWQRAIAVLERGLEMTGGEQTTYTGAALALQSVALSWSGRHSEAKARLEASAEFAASLEDPRLAVGVLSARAIHHWVIGEFQECIDAGLEAATALRAAGASWQLATLLGYVHYSLATMGRWEEAEEIHEELWPLAARIGQVATLLFARRWHEVYLHLRSFDLDRSQREAEKDLELTRSSKVPWIAESYGWLGTVELLRGNLDPAIELLEEAVKRGNKGAFEGWHHAVLILAWAYAGERDKVLEQVPLLKAAISTEDGTRTLGESSLVAMGAEALGMLGEWDTVTEFHQAVTDALGKEMRWRSGVVAPMAAVASMTARASGSTEEAEAYYLEALKTSDVLDAAIGRADSIRMYGVALMGLGDDKERARGSGLLETAASTYDGLGLAFMAGFTRALRDRETGMTGSAGEDQGSSDAVSAMYRQEGEYWTIGVSQRPLRLKDSVGLRYMAQLLKNPGQEIHALDLVALAEGNAADPSTRALRGDTGELLDPQAKSAYRARLTELQTELEEAEEWADDERAAHLRVEIQALTEELASAVGIGGRDRKTGSVAERARVNVTKALKATLGKISKADPDLGEHLAQSVRTGTHCAYLPGKPAPYEWTS